jgi:RES domain
MAVGGPPPLRPPPLPPSDIHSRKLALRRGARDLIRIGGRGHPALNFRATGANRFDAPERDYRTLYAASSLEVCFAETLLRGDRKTNPLVGGATFIPVQELEKWDVFQLMDHGLSLAVLAGPALKRLGGDAGVSSVTPYDVPQAWSQALHSHPANVDGVIYMSRHINTMEAVVLFERASVRLRAYRLHRLLDDPRLEEVLETLQIAI